MVKGGGVLVDSLFCFSMICFLWVMFDGVLMVIGFLIVLGVGVMFDMLISDWVFQQCLAWVLCLMC
jgi:hypothetical protein